MKNLLAPLFLLFTFLSSGQIFTSSNLPIIKINTNGMEIPDDPKIFATMGIINNPNGERNNVSDVFNEYDGNIGIEVRGKSSQMFPMKSYGIELRDGNGGDNNQPLFGLPAESDWVLYAPYTDKTFMRNFLAYTISNELGHWAAHCRYVEVMLNDEYIGVYVFMEKIKRDKGRVNIKKLENTDDTGDKLTGGYIFSIDKDADAWYSSHRPPNSPAAAIQFAYVFPKPEDITDEQKDYLKSYVDSFENTLSGSDFSNTQTGFRKFADENSFIDYFIVNELSRNVDGYRLSSYFYKNRNSVNPKIVAGPVWDYDLAFRNSDYCNGSNVDGWAYKFNYVCSGDYWQVPFWWDRFMEDPEFKSNLLCRWTSLRQNELNDANITHLIDSIYSLVSEAHERHFTKWPVLGQYIWPNPQPIPSSYAEEVTALKKWIADRLIWIDNNLPQLGDCSAVLSDEATKLNAVLRSNDAHLTWQTISEKNSDHFIIERSIDGTTFNQLSTVNAAGNSSSVSNYQYSDVNVGELNSKKLYYRLKLVSKTGQIKTSSVVSLLVKLPFEVNIFPNPVTKKFSVEILANKDQKVKLVVTNSAGKEIASCEKNLVSGANQVTYNSTAWAKGVYTVKVILEDGSTKLTRFIR
jgi:hypothetical protein